VRVKPDNPGGLTVAGQDDETFSSTGAADAGKLAPAAEAPALQALRAQERAEESHARPPHPAATPPATPLATPLAAPPAQPVSLPPAEKSVPASVPVSAMPEHRTTPAAPRTGPSAAASHATEASPASGHAAQVQLGALLTEAAAQEEWARLNRKAPDLLAARRPDISRMEHSDHPLWRLRTGGFADVAEATLFCQHARAKGVPCSIAAF
jgi:hypothetical protein